MKDSVRPEKIFYINIALAAALAVILIIMLRPVFFVPKMDKGSQDKPARVLVGPEKVSETAYDINKVKAVSAADVNAGREFSDFKDMYENAPPHTAGGNMVRSWSGVKPKEKERLLEGFDKEIVTAQEKLKEDPADKHAKNMLYISQTLKEMARSGFNYKFKDKK
jgi:hypothetical protein